MTSQRPNPESLRPSVRQTVWPWDAPTAVPASCPLWIRVAIQLAVMITLAGLFHLIGHTVMTRILLGLAVFFLLLATLAPRGYAATEMFFKRFAHGVGAALTHVLLLPFYWLCFVPARIILRIRGKDPLHRTFPAPEDSCWRDHPPPRDAASYRRQY